MHEKEQRNLAECAVNAVTETRYLLQPRLRGDLVDDRTYDYIRVTYEYIRVHTDNIRIQTSTYG